MNVQMEFPKTFEGFAKEFGFKDDKEVYSNGVDLIPVFRVKQWLEQDNKLRAIEIDTAYECGKHANKWIPVSERVPEIGQHVLVTSHGRIHLCLADSYGTVTVIMPIISKDATEIVFHPQPDWGDGYAAWMPLPEPYQSND